MKLVVKKRAGNTLSDLADWVDEQNTAGAGDRWLKLFYDHMDHIGKIGLKYAICKDESLAKYEYRCFTYNEKWIVAYKITIAKIIVYRFILGSLLKH
jgi:hypothetical protein